MEALQEYFLERWKYLRELNDPDEPEPTWQEKDETVWDTMFNKTLRFLVLDCGLSVAGADILWFDRIMPDDEKLLQMDPNMIHAFYEAVEEHGHDFNILFFEKAYAYYQKHANGLYTRSDYEEYLDYLDQNFYIEYAFAMLTPGLDDAVDALALRLGQGPLDGAVLMLDGETEALPGEGLFDF